RCPPRSYGASAISCSSRYSSPGRSFACLRSKVVIRASVATRPLLGGQRLEDLQRLLLGRHVADVLVRELLRFRPVERLHAVGERLRVVWRAAVVDAGAEPEP